MSTYRQILFHIIFRTKKSQPTIQIENSQELYAFMAGIIKNKGCFLYIINGMENHIHILTDLHPGIALADLVRDIKTYSSMWLKQSDKFPQFYGWAEGYAALTYTYREKEKIINYIKKQQIHHRKETFEQEYRRILEEYGIKIDERYFP
jgi:REP element-mobilizing transposase RayT